MKLRQKLAVVLASAMVVTAVPVVTMAASNSYVTKAVLAAKDSAFTSDLVIDVKDTTTTTNQMIYLDITGAKFDTATVVGATADGLSVESVAEGSVVLKAANGISEGKITVTLGVKDLSGDEVIVKVDGSATKAIDDATIVIAKKSDAKATVTFGDATSLDGKGAIADITIEEPFAGVFADKEIVLTLNNTNYEFTGVGTVEATKGLTGVTVNRDIVTSDKQVIKVTVDQASKTPGKIVLKGITVKCTDKKPALEEVVVNVSGDKVVEQEGTVAKVVEYGGIFKLSDKSVDIKAGQSEKVKVKLVENLADSFRNGGTVEFELDNAKLSAKPSGADDVIKNDDGDIIGFTYVIPTETGETPELVEKEFELDIVTELDEAGKDVTVTASGRAIGADQELTVASVKTAFEVSAQALTFKTGVKGQKGGVLTIAETDKAQLKSGKTFQIKLQDGAEFDDDIDASDIKVTSGDIIIDSVKKDSTTPSILNVKVKRASKTASTFEISNFTVKANRLLADGSYSVKLSGDALGNGELEVKDFLLVGEAAPAGTSTFALDSTTYVVNGKTYTMDVAPYADGGRIMVPVKYVAAALGVDGSNVIWDGVAKTVTIFGNRTVQVTLGSNVALVNGVPMTMDGKVTVKSERTFVPLGEIGKLLGVKATWNPETKSATFTN